MHTKKGFTLIELIVALAIVMIIIVAIGTTLTHVLQVHARISQEQVLIEESNDFINYLTFLVRLGTLDGTHTSKDVISFTNHALQNAGPFRIKTEKFTVDGQEFTTIIKEPYIIGGTAPTSTKETLLSDRVFVKELQFAPTDTTKSTLHPQLHYRIVLALVHAPHIETTLRSTISLRPFNE